MEGRGGGDMVGREISSYVDLYFKKHKYLSFEVSNHNWSFALFVSAHVLFVCICNTYSTCTEMDELWMS